MKKMLISIKEDYRSINPSNKYIFLMVLAGLNFILYGLYTQIVLITVSQVPLLLTLILLLNLALVIYASISYTIINNKEISKVVKENTKTINKRKSSSVASKKITISKIKDKKIQTKKQETEAKRKKSSSEIKETVSRRTNYKKAKNK